MWQNPHDRRKKYTGNSLATSMKVFSMCIASLVFLGVWILYQFTVQENQDLVTRVAGSETGSEKKKNQPDFWKPPPESSLQSEEKELVLYGKDLVIHTAVYFGPKGKVAAHSTNGMNCQNCHLEAGTKVFGNNYGSVASTYPTYRARSGKVEDLYKRINDCFERSLNGKPLKTESKEMQAMAAYIQWLGRNVPKGKKPPGCGLTKLAFPDRAADPGKGKVLYVKKCQVCHGADGQGKIHPSTGGFVYPPLWGKNSYNQGAGLFRISNFAGYIYSNMPLGARHDAPLLTDIESWDIAAFVNSQPRPHKDFSQDWPLISEKPFDYPFGPYSDGFTEIQHKFGPFKPIEEAGKGSRKGREIKPTDLSSVWSPFGLPYKSGLASEPAYVGKQPVLQKAVCLNLPAGLWLKIKPSSN